MEIPATLCNGSSFLIPEPLAEAYLCCLAANGLLESASGQRPNPPPVGGLTKQATDLHFAHAFDGSAARAQLAVLDPRGEVPTTAAKLLQFFSGGSLTFVDVPAGAGAAALSVLCTIAELRKSGVVPREPLTVHLIWGEISAPARTYAEDLIGRVTASLAAQAIFLTVECFSWDVLSELSNAALVEKIILSKSNHLQTMLMISNFNGFLEKENKKKAAYPQIAELIKYSSGKLNSAIWIEPDMNTAKAKLFPFIMGKLLKLAGFAKAMLPGGGNEVTSFKFCLPVNPLNTANVRLCVMPIDLVKDTL